MALIALVVAAVLLMVGDRMGAGVAPRATSPSVSPASRPATLNDGAPRTVFVLGDSLGMALSYALAATAPRGTSVEDDGLFGCGLAVSTAGSGLIRSAPCNSDSPVDQQWPAVYRTKLADSGPKDDVLFVAGPWEVGPLLIRGRWVTISTSSIQQYEFDQLRELVQITTAHGAHLDLLTMPCLEAPGGPGNTTGSDVLNKRAALYNGLLKKAARDSPRAVSAIPFGALLCPDGRFHLTLDGVQVRAQDRVHTPAYAPAYAPKYIFADNSSRVVAQRFYHWLSPRLWPLILHLSASRS